MKTIKLNRFNKPYVLEAITVKHLAQFFDQFEDVLRGRNLPLPAAHHFPGTDAYYDCWSSLLNSPEKLPDALIEALLAIEELADPQNRPLLEAAVQESRAANPWLELTNCSECLALQLWLISPYGHSKEDKPPTTNPPSAADPLLSLSSTNEERAGESIGASASIAPTPSLAQPMGEGSRVRAVPACQTDLPPQIEAAARTSQNFESTVAPEQSIARDEGGSDPDLSPNHQPLVAPTCRADLPRRDEVQAGAEQRRESDEGGSTPPLSTNTFHRHTGKVARLPHEVREGVNMMMHDHVPYATIIEKLGEHGKGLKHYHLSRWKKHGYQEWLRKQERKDLTRAKEQFALEILRENEAGKVHEASLQIAATQLCQFLADFDPATLMERLQSDPQNFVRLLNVLPKLTASGILCETHRVEIAERRETLKKDQIPRKDRGISIETIREIEEMLRLR